MKFTINYTVEDYQEAQKVYSKISKTGWVVGWFIPVVGWLLIVFVLWRWFRYTDFNYGMNVPLLVVGIFYALFPFIFINLNTRFLYKKSKFLHEPCVMEITEEEVKITGPLNSGTINWQLFLRSGHSDKVLVLLSTPRTMIMIPKRFVPSEEEWNNLLHLVEEKVKS